MIEVRILTATEIREREKNLANYSNENNPMYNYIDATNEAVAQELIKSGLITQELWDRIKEGNNGSFKK